MKIKLLYSGQELEVEITEEELSKLETKKIKKNGYERVELKSQYYYVDKYGDILDRYKGNVHDDDLLVFVGNCYSNPTVAKNNARADKLMRQLRRCAVEHRKDKLNWKDDNQAKYVIVYIHDSNRLYPEDVYTDQDFGAIYFDSAEAACFAIDTFHDDLIWYFTEYKDSLE